MKSLWQPLALLENTKVAVTNVPAYNYVGLISTNKLYRAGQGLLFSTLYFVRNFQMGPISSSITFYTVRPEDFPQVGSSLTCKHYNCAGNASKGQALELIHYNFLFSKLAKRAQLARMFIRS